jgi:dTDP-glucose 4,6-dehydratase
MLASLLAANRRLGLGCRLFVLTRSADHFRQTAPDLAKAEGVTLISGDVRQFEFPEAQIDYVVHGATDVVAQGSMVELFDTCIAGTRHVLDIAVRADARRVLLLSSGAVYGRQPPDLLNIPETYLGAPDPLALASAYSEGKRATEWLGAAYASMHGLNVTVARCFAFVGPYLPLDKHFAIGNFIRAALNDTAIEIQGDGTPYRSYMYAADMAAWLWTILLRGRTATAYNVGGEEAITIAQLASLVATLLRPGLPIRIARQAPEGAVPERYIPDTARAKGELGLAHTISLEDGILRTAHWHGHARPLQQGNKCKRSI